MLQEVLIVFQVSVKEVSRMVFLGSLKKIEFGFMGTRWVCRGDLSVFQSRLNGVSMDFKSVSRKLQGKF